MKRLLWLLVVALAMVLVVGVVPAAAGNTGNVQNTQGVVMHSSSNSSSSHQIFEGTAVHRQQFGETVVRQGFEQDSESGDVKFSS